MFLAVCPNPSIDSYVWVESLSPGKVHRANLEKRYPGGKGVHVAMAAKELNEEVILLGFWGGETGKWIKNQCAGMGIKCIGPQVEEWNRACVTFKSEGEYDETELLGCGPEINALDYKNFVQAFESIIGSAEVVTMSGSWPKGSPNDGYAELISICNKVEVPSFLDCDGNNFLKGISKTPFGIHLNKTEAKTLFPNDDPNQVIKILSKLVELPVITAGAEGLYTTTKNNQLLKASVTIKNVHSSVGSGDCLTAGLAIAKRKNLNIEETLKLAAACGAANCLREELGMLYKKDVDKLFEEVNLNYFDIK